MNQIAAPRPPIIRRRPNLKFDPARAASWLLSAEETETFLNAVSYVFPPGERFFIESVQHFQDHIADPQLKEDVRHFVYQEAMHTAEHSRCNTALTEAYPHGKKIERLSETSMWLARTFFSPSWQLATTCALEHFTAILADGLLRSQEKVVAESDPAFAALWLWHAVEEAEHKGVCFDVYRETCGTGLWSYLRRVIVMMIVSVVFLVNLFRSGRVLGNDNKRAGRNRVGISARFLLALVLGKRVLGQDKAAAAAPRGKWFILREVVSPPFYFDYYRPSFHPWDHDNRDRIEAWKARYKDFGLRTPGGAALRP